MYCIHYQLTSMEYLNFVVTLLKMILGVKVSIINATEIEVTCYDRLEVDNLIKHFVVIEENKIEE